MRSFRRPSATEHIRPVRGPLRYRAASRMTAGPEIGELLRSSAGPLSLAGAVAAPRCQNQAVRPSVSAEKAVSKTRNWHQADHSLAIRNVTITRRNDCSPVITARPPRARATRRALLRVCLRRLLGSEAAGPQGHARTAARVSPPPQRRSLTPCRSVLALAPRLPPSRVLRLAWRPVRQTRADVR
jgi:hypothetical protein